MLSFTISVSSVVPASTSFHTPLPRTFNILSLSRALATAWRLEVHVLVSYALLLTIFSLWRSSHRPRLEQRLSPTFPLRHRVSRNMTAQVVRGKAVIFKKRPKNRQPTIRYEPYPTVVVKPNKSKQQKPLDGDLEDGEIPDKKEGHTNNVGKANRSNDQGVQREQLVTNMRQLTSINELCHSYCRNGIDIQVRIPSLLEADTT